MKNKFLKMAVAGLALSVSSIANAGLINELYVLSGDQDTLSVLQGNSVVRSWNTGPIREYPIAVIDTVKTTGYTSAEGGREYDLNGTPTGNTFSAHGLNQLTDGTTDGLHNYAVSYISGSVYQFDLNWGNSSFLFSGVNDSIGITYDPFANSIWLNGRHQGGGYGLHQYSMDGQLLSTSATGAARNTWLAMDYSDGSLWLGNISNRNAGWQFSTTGLAMDSFVINSNLGNTLGAEFQFRTTDVPEPSTLAIFALSLVGLASRRFKKS